MHANKFKPSSKQQKILQEIKKNMIMNSEIY